MPVTQTMALLVPIRCCDAWRTSPALTHAPRTDNARRVCCSNLVSCNCVAGVAKREYVPSLVWYVTADVPLSGARDTCLGHGRTNPAEIIPI